MSVECSSLGTRGVLPPKGVFQAMMEMINFKWKPIIVIFSNVESIGEESIGLTFLISQYFYLFYLRECILFDKLFRLPIIHLLNSSTNNLFGRHTMSTVNAGCCGECRNCGCSAGKIGNNITFSFLKPGLTPNQEAQIYHILRTAGFNFVKIRSAKLDEATLREHYGHHDGRAFFKPMLKYLTSGESWLMILKCEEGGDAVQRLRDLIGPTDPKAGKPGQIRHDFGRHDPDVIFENAIHASGNHEEAVAEIARFFPGWPHKSIPSTS